MTNHVGFFKQEFYIHFCCGGDITIVYRDKVFQATADKSTWTDASAYGRALGIIEKQLDFLSPEEFQKKYFMY